MSTRDYKRGASDAMSAYEGHERKQETAARFVQGQIRDVGEKVDRVSDMIGDVVDYISDQEKANLYKLNTPVDIADLEETEQRVLLAVLYQLSADGVDGTEAQQGYIRAVQQYLGITNPQTSISLDAVENIEDIAAQKAIFQVVMEFFYLGSHPKTYTEDQMDFLDYFSVNKKSRREIVSNIEAIIKVTGLQGLMEKYGFAPEEAQEDNSAGTVPTRNTESREKITINEPLIVQQGEQKVFKNKIIHLCKGNVNAQGELFFKNCVIELDSEEEYGDGFHKSDSGEMHFQNCVFTATSTGRREFSFYDGADFIDCTFDKASYFFCADGSIENCKFTGCEKIDFIGPSPKNCEFSANGPISICTKTNKDCVDNCKFIQNNSIKFICNVTNSEFRDMNCDKTNRINLTPAKTIEGCTFENIVVRDQGFLIFTGIYDKSSAKSRILDCSFKNCRTTRYDKKLVRCIRETGTLFTKTVELENIDYSTCTGLDDVIYI